MPTILLMQNRVLSQGIRKPEYKLYCIEKHISLEGHFCHLAKKTETKQELQLLIKAEVVLIM